MTAITADLQDLEFNSKRTYNPQVLLHYSVTESVPVLAQWANVICFH